MLEPGFLILAQVIRQHRDNLPVQFLVDLAEAYQEETPLFDADDFFHLCFEGKELVSTEPKTNVVFVQFPRAKHSSVQTPTEE